MRIIGLDWGTVRVGIAMSDEEKRLAFPLQYTLETKKANEEIAKLVKEYQVEKIVIGLPLSLSGKETTSSKKVKQFGNKLEKILNIKIDYFDERFSTVASTHALREQDIKEKEQRSIKDNIAAALLLQKYLEKKN